MKIGDRVQWTSQSHGCPKTKEGEIAAIVPAGEYPKLNIPGSYNPRTGQTQCFTRKHESYVVRVDGTRYYWPRVNALKPLPEVQAAEVGE